MKKLKIVMLGNALVLLILEILPYGAVLNFAAPDGESQKSMYSYFSLTPYGYGNFGPFLTAVLSCVLFVLSVMLLLKHGEKILLSFRIVSAVALFTSFLPRIMLGTEYMTFLGSLITLLLTVSVILAFISKKCGEKENLEEHLVIPE